jgi:hypothetical protein
VPSPLPLWPLAALPMIGPTTAEAHAPVAPTAPWLYPASRTCAMGVVADAAARPVRALERPSAKRTL